MICVTDDPYMRDFYHWVLQGHCEGFEPPVDEGFYWRAEGGPIYKISIGYPKSPFWYHLGNSPNYLSSRTIYWYRAWQSYYVGDELIEIYGVWKQFTSINPMCTGFTNFDAKRQMRKYYSYHGIIMPCKVQADPDPPKCYHIGICTEWELIRDIWPNSPSYYWELKWNAGMFLPSSDLESCEFKAEDGFRRYCYVDFEWYNRGGDGWYSYIYSSGKQCETIGESGYGYYQHWNFLEFFSGENSYFCIVNWAVPPSHFRMWRSTTGELPSGIPS